MTAIATKKPKITTSDDTQPCTCYRVICRYAGPRIYANPSYDAIEPTGNRERAMASAKEESRKVGGSLSEVKVVATTTQVLFRVSNKNDV